MTQQNTAATAFLRTPEPRATSGRIRNPGLLPSQEHRPCGGSRLQFDVPIEPVVPGIVEIVGRETPAMFLQMPAGRADRGDVQRHLRLLRRTATLFEVARRAGGDDILPGRAPALGARNDMVEGQVAQRAGVQRDGPPGAGVVARAAAAPVELPDSGGDGGALPARGARSGGRCRDLRDAEAARARHVGRGEREGAGDPRRLRGVCRTGARPRRGVGGDHRHARAPLRGRPARRELPGAAPARVGGLQARGAQPHQQRLRRAGARPGAGGHHGPRAHPALRE